MCMFSNSCIHHVHVHVYMYVHARTHIRTLLMCWQVCERLLAYRVEMKVTTKKVDGILNRLRVAMPAPRDEKARPPCIPGEQQSCEQVSIGPGYIITFCITNGK
jgi:hypothetical protein